MTFWILVSLLFISAISVIVGGALHANKQDKLRCDQKKYNLRNYGEE